MIRHHIQQYLLKIRELLNARDAPHSVAGGTAIGVFLSFLPIFGFKTLAAMGLAALFRRSILASVIGVSLHDVLLPLWPLILRWQFQIGFWALSNPHHFAPKIKRADFRFSELLQWDTFINIGLPLVVGGLILAIPVSLISYGVVLSIMKARAARRQKLETATDS